MPENDKTDSDENIKPDKNNKESQGGLWIIIGVGIAAFVGVLAIGVCVIDTQKVRFITEFSLTVVLATLIGVHAYIYGGQWRVMQRQWIAMRRSLIHTRRIVGQNERVIEKMHESIEIERAKTNPRLRVSKVRIENFEAGQSPIFITTIANDGFLDATGVEIHIGIRLGDGRAFKWIDPQTVMIPARAEESYPLVTGASLSEQDMEGFKRKKFPIEVVVGIRFWNGSPNEPKDFCYRYCYRYLPWPGQRRPNDVRQFFSCDFNPGLNISLRISGMEARVTMGTVGVVIEKAAPPETQPQEHQDKNGANPDP